MHQSILSTFMIYTYIQTIIKLSLISTYLLLTYYEQSSTYTI